MNRFIVAVLCLICLTACGQPASGAILVMSPNGDATPVATLSAAATDPNAVGKTVVVTSALSAVQSNISSATLHAWPADRALRREKGGTIGNTTIFRIAEGTLVDFPGNARVFAGSGRVEGLKEARPEWWYSGSGSYHSAVNSAIAAIAAGNVVLDATTYSTTGTISVNKDRVNLIGSGKQATIINYNPSGNGTAIEVYKSTGICYQNALRGFTVKSDDTTYSKTAISYRNTSELKIENIAIYPFTGNGTSVGIQSKGKELTTINDISVASDLPFAIEDNPDSTIDSDHLSGHNWYLLAGTTNPVIRASSGVNITNMTLDGYQAWIGGNYGFYWPDTTSTLPSQNISFSNVRHEQATGTSGYIFYISHNYALQNILFDNIYGGDTVKGYYLRKVQHPTIQNSYYINAANNEALNVDSTVVGLTGTNNFWQQNTTASMTGQYLLYSSDTFGGSPLPYSFQYTVTPATTASIATQNGIMAEQHVVANNADVSLKSIVGYIIITDNADRKAMFILKGSTGGTVEFNDPDGLFTVTKDNPGTVNIYFDAGAYHLQNKWGDLTFQILYLGF